MARFIGETVDSVLGQDYPHIDYLVMDGGSRDGTVELLEDRGVRYVSEADGGQGDAVNKGFERTEGELFTFLNADDTLMPGAVSRAVEAFAANPEAGVVYGEADYVNEDGVPMGPYPTRPFLRKDFAYTCFICQPAAMMRRGVFEAVGGMDTGLHVALDYDLWLRASQSAPFAYFPERQATSRMYPGNKSLGSREALYRESIALVKRHFGYVPMSWLGPYAAFRTSGADQFTEQSEVGPRSRALALALGLRQNRGQALRFIADWQVDGFVELFPDGWMSKAHERRLRIPPDAERIVIQGRHKAQVRWPLILRVKVARRALRLGVVRRKGPFTLSYACPRHTRGHEVIVEVRSLWTWRPHIEGDVRRLSCFLDSIEAR
jgi:glycosyltransferase involved in cell wall biosynthesis